MTVGERQLRIAGVLEHVSAACDFVVEQAREAGLDERAIHHCYLAVDEACTNIIEHGYRLNGGDDAGVIDILCQHNADTLTITLMDDSPPFDPLERPDPDPEMPIAKRAPGGWGIFFIKKLMDGVTYHYVGRRNRLVMVKKIGKPERAPLPPGTASLKPVDVAPRSGNIWEVTPRGRLSDGAVAQLESVLARQLDGGHYWLILNMGEIDYISSGGVKMLVGVWQRAREQKGDLLLAALKPLVRESFETIGLDLVFTISSSADQAAAYFASKAK